MRIDLNADLGEGFGPWAMGDDDAMLGIVTTANVACGLHAGDPDTMRRTVETARRNGVAIGAHPGFHDLIGFGRRLLPDATPRKVENLVAYQVGALMGVAALVGHPVTHVKTHGALGNAAAEDDALADAVARGIRAAVRASADDIEGATGDLQRARVLAGDDPLSRALLRAHEGHVALARMRAALAHDDRQEAQRCLAAARAAIDDPLPEPETAPRRLASRNDDVRDAIVLLEQAIGRAPSLGGPRPPRVAGRTHTILLAHDASWMSVDFGERVSLASSPVLRSLLAVLAERHLRSPRAVCARPELLEAAWPGVRLRPFVLRNRLNVALSKLRKLGLGELLEHTEDGYRLAPGTVVHRV